MQDPFDDLHAVVIPAYEELPNLRTLLPLLKAELSVHESSVNIYVVTQRHADVAEMQEIRRLGGIPIRRYPGDSFGDAIRTGFQAVDVRCKYVVVMDADGSHSPRSVPVLLSASEDAHVVIASRYVRGGSTDNGPLLRMLSRILNLAYTLVLGLDIKDVSNNFKRYLNSDVKSLSLSCDDFDVVEEILVRLGQRHGSDLKVVELPDHFYERHLGVTKRRLGPFILSYLRTLVRLRIQLSREK